VKRHRERVDERAAAAALLAERRRRVRAEQMLAEARSVLQITRVQHVLKEVCATAAPHRLHEWRAWPIGVA
jgi:hypothetical protein